MAEQPGGPSETPPPELVAYWKGEDAPPVDGIVPEDAAAPVKETTPPDAGEPEPEVEPEAEPEQEPEPEDEEDAEEPARNRPGSRKYKARFEAQRAENERLRTEAMERAAEAAYYRGLAEGAGQQPGSQQPQGETAPDPDTFEGGQFDPKYIEALTEFKIRQAMPVLEQRALARAEQMMEQRVANEEYAKQIAAAKEQYPDFDEVIANSPKNVDLQSGLALAFQRSGNKPMLAYWLAQHPAEVERLQRLDPLSCAEELGVIRAQIMSATRRPTTPPALPPSAQRPPTRAVAGGGTGVRGHTIYDAPDLPTFKRLREAEEAQRG